LPTPVKQYAFINAKLRARLSKVLDKDFYERLASASNLNEAIILLKNTGFAPAAAVYEKTGDLKMSELELFKAEVNLLKDIQSYCTSDVREFIKALLYRYEIDNIKDALRLWFDKQVRKRDISYASGYIFRDTILNPISIDAIINSADSNHLIETFQKTPYREVLQRGLQYAEVETSIFPLENSLDLFFYRQLLDAVKLLPKRDQQILQKVIGVQIDIENIIRTVRFADFYHISSEDIIKYAIPGGLHISSKAIEKASSAGSVKDALPILMAKGYTEILTLSGFSQSSVSNRILIIEGILQTILENEIRKMLSGYPFTIGIVVSYFLIKRREISRIMTILNAINYHLDQDSIKGKI